MKPFALLLAFAPLPAFAQSPASTSASTSTRPTLVPLSSPAAPRVGKLFEMRLGNVPLRNANPFDPDEIAVDVTFTSPTKKILAIPAFWERPFSLALRKTGEGKDARESEVLEAKAKGEGEWRVRWTPLESGAHLMRILVRRGASAPSTSVPASSTWRVLARDLPRDKTDSASRGFVRLNPRNRRYFQFEDGTPLPLLGENLCWHGARNF